MGDCEVRLEGVLKVEDLHKANGDVVVTVGKEEQDNG